MRFGIYYWAWSALINPACELLFDTFHTNVVEKSVRAAIRTVGDCVGHIHACGNHRGAPGNGYLDWAGVVDGGISVTSEYREGASQ